MEKVTPRKRTPRKQATVKEDVNEEESDAPGVKDEPVEAAAGGEGKAAIAPKKRSIKQESGTSSAKRVSPCYRAKGTGRLPIS